MASGYLQCGPFLGFIWPIACNKLLVWVLCPEEGGTQPTSVFVVFPLPVVSGALNTGSFLTEPLLLSALEIVKVLSWLIFSLMIWHLQVGLVFRTIGCHYHWGSV